MTEQLNSNDENSVQYFVNDTIMYMDWGDNPEGEATARSLLNERSDQIYKIAFDSTSTPLTPREQRKFGGELRVRLDDVKYHQLSQELKRMVAETALKAFEAGVAAGKQDDEDVEAMKWAE